MTIRILGNGGFINTGIPYNSLLLGKDFLIEAPPDIMPTLRYQGISFHELKRIYISHFHGDHYFGMPFLMLNLMNHYLDSGKEIDPIELIGPRGIRDYLIQLQEIATSPDNPSVAGIDKQFIFTEIDSASTIRLHDSKTMIFHPMNHSKETYGFSIIENGRYLMTYLIDTKWDESFTALLTNKPKYVFCDLNSQPDDKIKQHLSEKEIVEKAISITGTDTEYIGIHLSGVSGKDLRNLHYSQTGETYEV